MGKHRNKPHRHKKDNHEHKERSKKEHKLRKDRKEQATLLAQQEQACYLLTPTAKSKLITALRELLSHDSAAQSDIPNVFKMLDDGLEVDIVDVESGYVRDRLEVIFAAMEGMIERREDEDGRFVYGKKCVRSVKEQIEKYLIEAKQAPREAWMTSLSDHLETQFGPMPVSTSPSKPSNHTQDTEYMEEYNRIHRPKSLLELHQERTGSQSNPLPSQALHKRFAKGSFL